MFSVSLLSVTKVFWMPLGWWSSDLILSFSLMTFSVGGCFELSEVFYSYFSLVVVLLMSTVSSFNDLCEVLLALFLLIWPPPVVLMLPVFFLWLITLFWTPYCVLKLLLLFLLFSPMRGVLDKLPVVFLIASFLLMNFFAGEVFIEWTPEILELS